MDPYRGDTQIGVCPRCQNELVADGELGLACVRGCGEWVPRETADHRLHWDQVIRAARYLDSGWPWGTAACPSCQLPMTVAYREELRFDRCDRDGVWLDTGERERFFQLFSRR